ncbi:outer membrane lipoprotein-sorting protein [Spirochaetota bacterium]
MKEKYKKIVLLLSIFFVVIYSELKSQESRKVEITAQGILARVDRVMEYPRGEIKGIIKHIMPDGKSFSIYFKGCITKEDFLFIFRSKTRGMQLKVLYNLSGEEIWVFNILSIKLYNKKGIDKYDSILGTNFFYIDLSNADLQSNYTASIVGSAIVKGFDAYKLKLKPIFKAGLYGSLTLYVKKDNYIPLQIDFHDRDNALFKFMTIAKVRKRGKRVIPIRYDMMHLRRGTVTILNFFSFDEDVKFEKEIFRSEKLGG